MNRKKHFENAGFHMALALAAGSFGYHLTACRRQYQMIRTMPKTGEKE